MSTSKGVVQGYCGAAVVDAAHQVIVEASAFGTGSEQELLMPLRDACANQRHAENIITAVAGYGSGHSFAAHADAGIRPLIADNLPTAKGNACA